MGRCAESPSGRIPSVYPRRDGVRLLAPHRGRGRDDLRPGRPAPDHPGGGDVPVGHPCGLGGGGTPAAGAGDDDEPRGASCAWGTRAVVDKGMIVARLWRGMAGPGGAGRGLAMKGIGVLLITFRLYNYS